MTTASNDTAIPERPPKYGPAWEIIRREIGASGPMTFARFMECALYCPEFGYYERFENIVGKAGDYYTSISVGSLFGELLAFQFAQWFEDLSAEKFQIVEAAAHDGQLAADILNWFKAQRVDPFENSEYWILEPSPRRREWQAKKLKNFAHQVHWAEQWESLPSAGIRGVIFFNELLDAMPTHRIAWDAKAGAWSEWAVDLDGQGFVWKKTTPSVEVTEYLPQLPPELLAVLPDGFTTDICPGAIRWWKRAATALKKGRLLTFDYGLSAEGFFSSEHARGTLRAYYRHRPGENLLANVGEQDLTADVNFTAIQKAGESVGLKTEGLFSQAHFLTRVVRALEKADALPDRWTSDRARQFQTLTHPEHLGTRFKVLVQSR